MDITDKVFNKAKSKWSQDLQTTLDVIKRLDKSTVLDADVKDKSVYSLQTTGTKPPHKATANHNPHITNIKLQMEKDIFATLRSPCLKVQSQSRGIPFGKPCGTLKTGQTTCKQYSQGCYSGQHISMSRMITLQRTSFAHASHCNINNKGQIW